MQFAEKETLPDEKRNNSSSALRGRDKHYFMPKVKDKKCGTKTVSSKVRVGKPGSSKQRSYCKRTAKIKGNWKKNPCSKNAIQRRRWKCN